MASKVTASIVVNFELGGGAGSTTMFKVELDKREDLYNKGKTSFAPGDDVYFMLYKTADAELVGTPFATHGTLNKVVSDSTFEVVEEGVQFTGTGNIANTNYPQSGSDLSGSWLGKNLNGSNIEHAGEISVKGGVEDEIVGIAEVNYTAVGDLYVLTNTDSAESIESLLYFKGTSTED